MLLKLNSIYLKRFYVQSDFFGAPIVEHADVRRMLMTMKAYIEAMRGLVYITAEAIDISTRHPDPGIREPKHELLELLIPVVKAWCTDLGSEVASLAIQVWGGMGYIEESGVAQHYRDARISAIYEGTNGIQAMDLVGRKLPMRGGGAVKDLLGMIALLDPCLLYTSPSPRDRTRSRMTSSA